MQEYYIRKEGDEDSRGPFTPEQLASLVEAGQVDRQTYYYDAVSEKWVEIQSNPELAGTLFPVKKKLTIRPKENIQTVNLPAAEDEKPITVEEMLAAAEGQTEETHARRDLTDEEARAAAWGLRAMSLVLLLSAVALLVSRMEVIGTLDLLAIITTPLVLIGVLDLLLALLLFLEVTAMYRLVRLRAAAGIGFFGFYFGVVGDWRAAIAVALGSAALYVLTFMCRLGWVVALGLLGLAGMGGFAYLQLY